MKDEISLNGKYYEFFSMDDLDETLIKSTKFKNDREAIQFDANYEAYVNKVVFKDNVLKSRKQIYDPMSCFD